MSDPVEDGVRLLRDTYDVPAVLSNDEMRVIVRNIIAPAEKAAERRGMEIADARRALRAPADTAWWELRVANAVQAERERIRTGVDALIPAGLYPAENRNINNVIDGKENSDDGG